MEKYWHQNMASGRWHTFSLAEQMGNIGSEFERAARWQEDSDAAHKEQAKNRMFELMDLTISDLRWQHLRRLRELTRTREVLTDFFYGDNIYNSTADDLKKYFFYFALLARKNK